MKTNYPTQTIPPMTRKAWQRDIDAATHAVIMANTVEERQYLIGKLDELKVAFAVWCDEQEARS